MTTCPKPQPRPKKPRKPLRRSRMSHKRPRRVDRETELEKRYKAWVHTQPCVVLMKHPFEHFCDGMPVQQAHLRDHTGASLKASNLESLPLCRSAHDSYDGRSRGWFYRWPLSEKKLWFKARLIEAHARYEIETGEAILPPAHGG